MDKETIKRIQNEIGYEFKNPRLLEQAFVRQSYANENPGIKSNEVLEFYGDRALEIFVTKRLYDMHSFITDDGQLDSTEDEDGLTKIKSMNVNSNNLAHCIRLFNYSSLLYLNESDRKNKVYENPHVQEDLFEAIIGAVTADSGWDFDKIFNTCETMLRIVQFERNYLEWLKDWCNENNYEIPTFYVDLGSDKSRKSKEPFALYTWVDAQRDQKNKQNQNWANYDIKGCTVTIKEIDLEVKSERTTLKDAQMDCAKQIYDFVELKELKEAVGEPDFNNAVNQLNMLCTKGFIDEPLYEFDEEYDEDGNPVWTCVCSVDELDCTYSGDSSNKKEAKKIAAYGALCDLLDYDDGKYWDDEDWENEDDWDDEA